MSVVIRGMEMPKNCAECPFLYAGDACYAVNKPGSLFLPVVCNSTSNEYRLGEFPYWEKRVDWCPLEESPVVFCEECARNADNGGLYDDGTTRCPIQTHYALLLDGHCHLGELKKEK